MSSVTVDDELEALLSDLRSTDGEENQSQSLTSRPPESSSSSSQHQNETTATTTGTQNQPTQLPKLTRKTADSNLMTRALQTIFGKPIQNKVICPLKTEVIQSGSSLHENCRAFNCRADSYSNARRHLNTWHPSILGFLEEKTESKTLCMEDIDKLPRLTGKSTLSQQTLDPFVKQETSRFESAILRSKIYQALTLILKSESFESLESQSYISSFTELGIDPTCLLTKYELSKIFLPALYHCMTQELIMLIQDLPSIWISYDAWSDCTMEKYLTITGHLMTKEWQIMTPCLATIPWDGVMSGDSISETILDKVLTDTDCFIFAVTSDGGSNMIAAGQDLVGSDTVRCFLHILHLLFGSFMDDPSYSEKISSLREYIKTIRRCQNKRLVLKKSAKQAKLKRSSLILDNVTRWNSTYLMIVRYIEFLLLLRDLHHNDEAFRDLSFPLGTSSFYQAIVKLWEPFYNITIEAQSRALSTLPMIPGWIDNLYSHLDKILQTPTHSEIRDIALLLRNECQRPERFGLYCDAPNIALCAAALTPYSGRLRYSFVSSKFRKAIWKKMKPMQWSYFALVRIALHQIHRQIHYQNLLLQT